jgi:hypothetical protein
MLRKHTRVFMNVNGAGKTVSKCFFSYKTFHRQPWHAMREFHKQHCITLRTQRSLINLTLAVSLIFFRGADDMLILDLNVS